MFSRKTHKMRHLERLYSVDIESLVASVLSKNHGRLQDAAHELGLSPQTLYYWITKMGYVIERVPVNYLRGESVIIIDREQKETQSNRETELMKLLSKALVRAGGGMVWCHYCNFKSDKVLHRKGCPYAEALELAQEINYVPTNL